MSKTTITERVAILETEVKNFRIESKEDMTELKEKMDEHIGLHRQRGFVVFQNIVAAAVGGVVAAVGLLFKDKI